MEDASLTSGGVRTKVEIVARIPSSLEPVPRYGELVEIVATGRKLRVQNVLPADANNPLAAEHIVELSA